jgi:hypothetical protein
MASFLQTWQDATQHKGITIRTRNLTSILWFSKQTVLDNSIYVINCFTLLKINNAVAKAAAIDEQ